MRASLLRMVRSATLVAILVVAFLIWAYHSSLFRVENLQVEGASWVPQQELLSLTDIKPGKNQLKIDLEKEATKLVSHPLVAEAEIGRKGPRGVRLRVKEELPAAVLAGKERFGLSLDGRVLPLKLCESFSPLPVLSVPGASVRPFQKVSEPLILYALGFYREFLHIDPLWAGRVSEISFTASGDLFVRLGPKPVNVNFGRGSFPEKIYRLIFILEENLHRMGEVESIDVRMGEQVFVFPEGAEEKP